MAKINCAWAAVLLFAVCKAQFFYNDDEQQPAYQGPPPQDSTYEYDNPPTAAQYNPSQQRSHSENFRKPVNYQPQPRTPPAPAPEYEHRPEPSRGRRRGSERRQWQPPPPRPRVYSPSVFENLALGKAPTGVSVPEDSFLNVLTNGGRAPRVRQSPAYEPAPPQQTSYVQPPTAQAPPPPAYAQNPPAVGSRASVVESRPYSRGPAPPPRVQRAHALPQQVHNLPRIEEARPESIESPVQYQAPPAPVQASPVQYHAPPAPQRSSRRRSGVRSRQTTTRSSWNSGDEEYQRPQRVFGPSVFENLGPGMAPPGIQVPEDSFLNILRNDKPSVRTRRDHVYEPAPPAAPIEEYESAPPLAPVEQYEPAPPPQPVARYAPARPPQPVARYAPAPPPQPVARYAPAPPPAARHAPAPPPQPVARYAPAPPPAARYAPAPQAAHAARSAPAPPPAARYAPAPQATHVARPAPAQYSTESRPSSQEVSTDYESPQDIPVVQPTPRRSNRQHQRPQPEFVDNTANHQTNEEQPQVVRQRKPTQGRRTVTVRRHRQFSGSIADADENEEDVYRPPKQFAPSLFENFGLGEAPPGIYVPEDSFLNLLRGDRPISRSPQSPGNQRTHLSPPPEAAPISDDVSDRQNRRSRVSQTNQSPPQRHQSAPVQEYQPVNPQTPPEIQRPVTRGVPHPAVVHRAVPSTNRQRQRSQRQPASAPQPQPIYEVSNVVYNARSDPLEDDDILRYRNQDNNQRVRQQEQAPQRKRTNTAPQYAPPPPPQPVYEAPQPNYDDSFQPEDIPRRRPPSRNQRPTQIQQPAQRPRAGPQSRRSPPQPQPIRSDEVPDTRQQNRFQAAKLSVKPLPDDVDGDQIPGEAGIDYPTFHVIPKTSFSCAQQPHNGYYADVETSCQVMHLCQSGGVQSSFLCPNGTIFSQEKFSCQWWYKVNCADAPSHYGVNDKLYKVPPQSSRRNEE